LVAHNEAVSPNRRGRDPSIKIPELINNRFFESRNCLLPSGFNVSGLKLLIRYFYSKA